MIVCVCVCVGSSQVLSAVGVCCLCAQTRLMEANGEDLREKCNLTGSDRIRVGATALWVLARC